MSVREIGPTALSSGHSFFLMETKAGAFPNVEICVAKVRGCCAGRVDRVASDFLYDLFVR